MMDGLRQLINNAHCLVASGYYAMGNLMPGPSLRSALRSSSTFPVIAEVKLSSPLMGSISPHSPERLVRDYLDAGAAALSILTEPNYFGGSIDALSLAAAEGAPTLMKDIIMHRIQILAGATKGASAILLIEGVFDTPTGWRERDELIAFAHDLEMEVVLEAGSQEELEKIIASEADILGLNQRDLRSLSVDREMGVRSLRSMERDGRPIIVMSGIDSRDRIIALRDAGADSVLVGTSLSSSLCPGIKLRSLVVSK